MFAGIFKLIALKHIEIASWQVKCISIAIRSKRLRWFNQLSNLNSWKIDETISNFIISYIRKDNINGFIRGNVSQNQLIELKYPLELVLNNSFGSQIDRKREKYDHIRKSTD